MKRAGLYICVSTLEQAQEGYSIGAQKERLIAFCKAHDWTIMDIYVDGGYTGANINRPGLQKLISEIDIVLVYKLDRLSRSQKDTLYLIEEVFLPNNVDFVSMSESFDTSTPFGRAMIGILSVFAQLEREQIKERTHMGLIARAKQGLYHGGGKPPIGYNYDHENGKLVINEYEAIQIKKIFEWYSNGMSTDKIAERLKSEGYKNKYKSWDIVNGSTVAKILCNDVYLGVTHFGDVVTENTHEPIITREQFEKTQEIKIKRQEIYGDTAFVSAHLLTGMIFCGRCGARYFAKRSYSRYEYFLCYSRAKASKRCKYLESAVEAKRRYRIISGGKDKNVLPACVMENDILCENGITLCYINSARGSEIADYEVVYDCDVVRLFYKVTIRYGNVVTVYRTEADTIDNFVFFNFFIELSSQLNSMIDEIFTRNFLKAILK